MPMQEMTLINLIILNEMLLLFKIAIFCIFKFQTVYQKS